MVPVNAGPTGVCKHVVLEEDEERSVYRDSLGVVAEINKKGDKSIPHFLEFPIKDRKTWEPYKEALDPASTSRYRHLREALPRLRKSTGPVGIPGGSLAGTPRNLMGFERIAVLPYEDPELFSEIVDTFGRCIVAVLERVLPLIQVDFCMGWEDICFNQGPAISPHVYREVVGPWYRRIADLLIAHGCCVYTTDTDGNIMPLVDIFLDNGLNTMFPVEVHGGSDPVALRRKYGKRIRLWGGFDKMALLKGREAIDNELERLRPHVEEGGFIPGVDHRVQADVPLDNYKYYLDRKRALYNVGGEPKY
jgi:uroporphyrinogen decarboxylase